MAVDAEIARGDIFNVGSFADYQAAMLAIALDPADSHTVNITSGFTMTDNVVPIAVNVGQTVNINGGGNVIDGGGQFRAFFASQGNITISNVTVQNARASGGNGGGQHAGGGGGLGAGAGIFVDQTANVVLDSVNFSNGNAVGGSGGNGANVANGGGGGGLGGNGGSAQSFPGFPFAGVGGGGGGGLYGDGGNPLLGGGGGGGVIGDGGDSGGSLSGAGGGGSFAAGGDGGDGTGFFAGGGGGAGTGPGGDGEDFNPGAGAGGTAGAGGGAAGANGGSSLGTGGGGGGSPSSPGSPGDSGNGAVGGDGGKFGGGGGGAVDNGTFAGDGGYFGGGGGAGDGGATSGFGGNGGDFGGGGGSVNTNGGNGGFGGGGGGAGDFVPRFGGAGGFGAGKGGDARTGGGDGGGGGDALGGNVFVRSGGTLVMRNSGISGGSVTLGNGGNAGPGAGAVAGTNGVQAGEGIYLNEVDLNLDVTGTNVVTIDSAIADNTFKGGAASAVTKSGTGTLNFNTAAHTYAGGTNVNAGRLNLNGSLTSLLSVNNGATLGGNGTAGGGLFVNAGGTVAPGNSIGTLNVIGTYNNNGGNYDVELNAAANPTTPGVDNDLIDVTGNAIINGGTVNVFATGSPAAGTTYDIVRTTTGVSGLFANVVDDRLLVNFSQQISGNNLQLLVIDDAGNFTFNQQAVAGALDQLPPGSSADLQTVTAAILSLPNSARGPALDQLSGELHATVGIAGLQNTTLMFQTLGRQLRSGNFGSPQLAGGLIPQTVASSGNGTMALRGRRSPTSVDGLGGPSYKTALAASSTNYSLLASGNGLSDLDDPAIIRGQDSYSSAWGVWATGYGLWGTADPDGNAAGFDYTSGGQLLGVHYWLDSETVLGGYFGQARYQVTTGTPFQSASVDGFQSGFYLRRGDGLNYYLLAGGFTYDDFETQRTVNIAGINRTARGDHFGLQGAAYIERGQTWFLGNTQLQPLVALQYINHYQESFTETGAMALNLNVDSLNVNSLRMLLGGRVSRDWTWGCWGLSNELRAMWMHEYLDDNAQISTRFSAPNAGTFATRGVSLGRDWALVGTGLTLSPNSDFSLFVNYDVQLNGRQTLHVAGGGVQLLW